jgi:hypothetical protein
MYVVLVAIPEPLPVSITEDRGFQLTTVPGCKALGVFI